MQTSRYRLLPERLIHLHCDRCPADPFAAYAPPGTVLTLADLDAAAAKHEAEKHARRPKRALSVTPDKQGA